METANPYILSLQSQAIVAYQHEWFYQVCLGVVIVCCFLYGRIMHVKKLQHLLDMVNDSDYTRKLLSERLESTMKSIKWVESQKNLFRAITLVIMATNGLQFYAMKQVILYFVVISFGFVILIWLFYWLRIKYLKWKKSGIQSQLKTTSLNAEQEIKDILATFGHRLQNQLRHIYENELNLQWAKEQKEQCKLYQCHSQKKAYRQLFNLYQRIINEIKQINLCNICLHRQNISRQALALPQFQILLKNCYRILQQGKITIERKKQLVNKLLADWQKMIDKLPYLCKKGCCIKQRILIQGTKTKNHGRLKQALQQLSG